MIRQEKIRVLHTQQIIWSGGVEQRKYMLLKHLPAEKYTQEIICTIAKGSLYEKMLATGIQITQTGTMHHPFEFRIHFKVSEVIRRFRPHIIHGSVFEGVSMAAVGGLLHRVPIIILEETSSPETRSHKATKLLQIFSHSADAVIGVSPAATDYLRKTAKINEKKVRLLLNGVNPKTESFSIENKEELRKKLHIPLDAFLLGSVGRMDNDVKRFPDLIYAVKLLKDSGYPVYLLLVGEGDKLKDYQHLTSELGITDRVIFTGYQENVHPYYSIMDAFALISSSESFGLVIAEAWLHSLPVIGSRTGGVTYIIDNEVNGLLIPTGNTHELTQAVIKLFREPEQRERLGNAGCMKSHSEYTSEIYLSLIHI